MRYRRLLPVAVSLGVLGACTDRQTTPTAGDVAATRSAAVTPAMRSEFAGFVHFCEGTPPEAFKVTRGGTLHLRAGNRNQWVGGNALVDGFEENAALVNVDLKNGTGAAHLDVTLRPEAVDGTWEIRQTVIIRGGGLAGSHGVGHGTGELHGMTIKFTTEPRAEVENPCNPDLPSARLHGVVISPGTSG